MVLRIVTDAITVISFSVKREVIGVILAVRWGTELISVPRVSKISLLLYHLQSLFSRFNDLVPTRQ